jgi:hypothetical protein
LKKVRNSNRFSAAVEDLELNCGAVDLTAVALLNVEERRAFKATLLHSHIVAKIRLLKKGPSDVRNEKALLS